MTVPTTYVMMLSFSVYVLKILPSLHEQAASAAARADAHRVVIGEALSRLLRVHGHHGLSHDNLSAVRLLQPHDHSKQR